MREFPIPLTEGIQRGLRPVQTGTKNSGILVNAANMGPVVGGLWRRQEPEAITSLEAAWPFPQPIVTSQRKYLASETTLYEVSSTGTLSAKFIGSVGTRWTVVDYIDYELWSNGVSACYRRPSDGSFLAVDTDHIPKAGLFADFDGQAFAAGMPTGWYDARDNVVAWSRIGAVDFLMPSTGDLDRHYTMGNLVLQQDGPVYALMRAGQHMVAYTASGISIIQRPTSSMIPVSAGWGQKDSKPYKVNSRGAVCGDRHDHFFVTATGSLWRLTSNMEFVELGYREFFEDMEDVVLSWNPELQQVIISDAYKHYIYSAESKSLAGPMDYGLQGVHTIWDDRPGMFVTTPDNSWMLGESVVVTDIFDMKSSMIKTIGFVELEGELPRDVMVCTYFRFNRREPFRRTPWVPTTPEGVAHPACAGVEFRLGIRSRTSPFLLEGAVARYKNDDRRFVRGTSVQV